MKLLFENWRQYLKEATDQIEPGTVILGKEQKDYDKSIWDVWRYEYPKAKAHWSWSPPKGALVKREVGKISRRGRGKYQAYDDYKHPLGHADTLDDAKKLFSKAPAHATQSSESSEEIKKHNEKELEAAGIYTQGVHFRPDKPDEYQRIVRKLRGQINDAPPLSDNKIIRMLGQGAYGTAFLLNNDHVLKLFKSGVEGVERDLEHYKKLQSSQSTGSGRSNEPAIFDFGQIPETGWNYVEMSKVIPLPEWLEMTGRAQDGVESEAYSKIDKAFRRFKERLTFLSKRAPLAARFGKIKALDSLSTLINTIKEEWENNYSHQLLRQGITEKENNQLLKSILQLVKLHGTGQTYDLHMWNIGVRPRQNGLDEMVIFDF